MRWCFVAGISFHPLASFLLAGYLSRDAIIITIDSLKRWIAPGISSNASDVARDRTLLDERKADAINRKDFVRQERRLSRRGLSFQELTRGQKKRRSYAIAVARGSAIDRIAKRNVLSRIRQWIRFTPLHPAASNDESCLSNRAKAWKEQHERNEDRAGVRGDFMRRFGRSADPPSIRNGADSVFMDVNFRAVCHYSPYADDAYRNRALFRWCSVTSRARARAAHGDAICRGDQLPRWNPRDATIRGTLLLFQQQQVCTSATTNRIVASLRAQISTGVFECFQRVENSDICFLLLVVPAIRACVVPKCIKEQQLTQYQVRVSWEEVGDHCGPGSDWSRVPLALESRRRGFPPSSPCSNRKIPWITNVIN
jgi:hypothetical protein